MTPRSRVVNLDALIHEFYPSQTANHSPLGKMSAVEKVPGEYDRLLDHNHHMTVTVESYHQSAVDVVVHQYHRHDNWYVREITLVRKSDRAAVQYGIVRFDITSVEPEVWAKIESQSVPLGRVLISHEVHRTVHLEQLWEIQTGPVINQCLHLRESQTIYGRTALIRCNDLPAIELLEVVVVDPISATAR